MKLDEELFSRFVGLYVMKLDIPEDLYEYVRSHKCPSSDVDVNMVFASILGATDMKDVALRPLVKALI